MLPDNTDHPVDKKHDEYEGENEDQEKETVTKQVKSLH